MNNKIVFGFLALVILGLIAGLYLMFARGLSGLASDPEELEAIERDIRAESFNDLEAQLTGVEQELKAAGY